MTLNGVMVLILRFFSPNSIALQADYVTLVEDRPIMSVNIISESEFQSSTFGQNKRNLQRGLSVIAEHLVTNDKVRNINKTK